MNETMRNMPEIHTKKLRMHVLCKKVLEYHVTFLTAMSKCHFVDCMQIKTDRKTDVFLIN